VDLATGVEETEVGRWVIPLVSMRILGACTNIARGDIGLRIGCGEDVFLDPVVHITR
jgi:hypothetical protein